MHTPRTYRPRPHARSLAVALVASTLAAAPSAAQQQVARADGVPAHERSPLVAGLLQAALPPLPVGYLYAGSLARGLIPTGVMIVGSSLFLIETVETIDWTDEGGSDELMMLGIGMTLGAYVFGIVDAANAATNRNARARAAGAELRFVPAGSGLGLVVSIRVG